MSTLIYNPLAVLTLRLQDTTDHVERYLRVTVEIPGGCVEAGLQRLGIGEPVTILRSEFARLIAEECSVLGPTLPVRPRWWQLRLRWQRWKLARSGITDEQAQRIIDSLESRLLQTWPQRLWFVEFWNHHEALTQTYHPSWMRRDR